MTDEEMCERVADLLTKQGIPASAQDTGGNVWLVEVPEPLRTDTKWLFGTASETWGGFLYFGEQVEEDDPCINSAVGSDDVDPRLVARALAAGLERWRSSERRDLAHSDDKAALERSRRRQAVRRDGTVQASTALMVYAECPYCEFSGEIKLDDGWYDNQWDGGRGAFRSTCPSCGKPYAIEKSVANDVQHAALVILGEASL